ncbi:uncharacterized protein [Panulirus ornatus]|uniref:uncharacterized protein n=1 Tax=Panulirus ornatus TaxID=150431 RepID=UPI003A8B9445
MEGRRYLRHLIGKSFTRADGTTRLYLGQETVFPSFSAWPLPHDAPFKPAIDRCLMAVIEAGLYEKWSDDLLNQARLESSRAKREFLEQQKELGETVEEVEDDSEGHIRAINLIHIQGPLLLLLLGLLLSSLAFSMELLGAQWTRHDTGDTTLR